MIFGNLRPQLPLLVVHVLSAVAGVAAALVWIQIRASSDFHQYVAVGAGGLAVLSVVVSLAYFALHTPASYSIVNPTMPPARMADEAYGGADGMFFPSSAFTVDADTIPGSFFSRSESCGRSGCHPDIVAQWEASAHRFSSFNNQWYRKSIEYLQEAAGLEAPKWCAGCHDHALLFSGQMAQPVDAILDLPEAEAGTGCMSCHSIKSVTGTMGNGGIEIAYPLLHEIATSDNRSVQVLHDFALRIDPEPHRRAFLKPLHRRQTAEFCSACHKVHLDTPLNDYRWVRGFNTYDNWQSSGVSGHGARSFYEPDVPVDCGSCHMPLVASDDAGNRDGFVHNHRFVAANTALPTANQDTVQLEATIDFLKADRLSVDIFAVVGGPTETGSAPPPTEASTAATGSDWVARSSTFAAGDQRGIEVGIGGVNTTLQPIVAPLHPGLKALKKGSSVRIDVVVRSQSVGHFFPSGTVDAQEAWLELKVLDEDDNVLFWSGRVADLGRGEVDASAHFYRNLLVDDHGNRINKRNAWAARSVVYVNLIPPGAADVAHYRFPVPSASTASLRIVAALHYRKFDWWHNQFAYAGEPEPESDSTKLSIGYDDRDWVFTRSTADVSGNLKSVPELPIVTMATDTLRLLTGSDLDSGMLVTEEDDRGRWNDYGIGLLLEGDLKGAERAFTEVTEIDPDYADGWVNLVRVYLLEGDIDAASNAVSTALTVKPRFSKALYFRALVYKALGEYDTAISDLQTVALRFPKDRVVIGQIGRIQYLNSNLNDASVAFERVLSIDPEDLGAHYNLMLIERALGNEASAVEHERRYERFKADESAPSISRAYRQQNPSDNNEALSIHEHFNSPWPAFQVP